MHTLRAGLAIVLAALAFVGATPAPAHLTIGLQIGRTSLDLLDPVAIGLIARNPTDRPISARFPAPQEDLMEITDRSGTVVWTSAAPPPPHGVTFPAHMRGFVSGTTAVIVRDWNALSSQNWSPKPGTYVIRARLLCEGTQPSTSVTMTFAPPLTPDAFAALPENREVTMAGTLDATRGILTGTSASAPLARRLNTAPAGVPVVVRGYATQVRGGPKTFFVARWAPLGPVESPPPPVVPSPSPSAMKTL